MTEDGDNSRIREGRGKSGQQIARDNVERVRDYVEGLKQRGEPLPIRKGQPNWTAIALACGFARGVFYDNGEARSVIERATEDPNLKPVAGCEPEAPRISGRAAHTQKKLEGRDRDVKRLEERLAVKTAECESLRLANKELEERLRQLSAFEEVMASSGRRFIP